MKLVKLECPNCHANIEVNSEFETAVCNYCRTEFLIKDENESEEERIKELNQETPKEFVSKTTKDFKIMFLIGIPIFIGNNINYFINY